MPNMIYRNKYICIAIPPAPRDHAIMAGVARITFNLDIESKDETRSIVNKVVRALVKKKVQMLGSK